MEKNYTLQDLVKVNETLAVAAQHLIDMEDHMRLALYHNNRCVEQLRQYNATPRKRFFSAERLRS